MMAAFNEESMFQKIRFSTFFLQKLDGLTVADSGGSARKVAEAEAEGEVWSLKWGEEWKQKRHNYCCREGSNYNHNQIQV